MNDIAKPQEIPRKRLAAWRIAFERAEACIDRGDLEGAAEPAREAAAIAEELRLMKCIRLTARLLIGLSDWGRHAQLLRVVERIRHPDGPPEWDGSALPGGTLVIAERHIAVAKAIRFGRLIAAAAKRVRRCVVLAEPRLVTLFRRSFPDVDVREAGVNDAAAYAEASAVAGYFTLVQHLAFDDEAVPATFLPLVPDPTLVQAMRKRYGTHRLIGIAWHSTNAEKNLPPLEEWATLLRSVPATYVSLQYGDVARDVAALRAASGATLIHDETVDSLLDLDTYAAQVAAMDAVVMISNTGAHMAGALGVRTYVLVEEIRGTRLPWPLQDEDVAWYPSVTVVHKFERPWPDVFEEVRQRIQ